MSCMTYSWCTRSVHWSCYSVKPKSMLFFSLKPLLLCIFVFAVCDAMVSKPAIACNFCDLNVLMYILSA